MMEFFKIWKGKLTLLLIFYIPFLSAIFFNFFDGKQYESPIGGCCIPMEGVVIAGYALFTIWILAPIFLVYLAYKLCKKFRIWRVILPVLAIALGAFLIVYGGYDDSPGGQLLGLLMVIGAIVGLIKNRKKNCS
jgi:FtsH-binding integral membrane protein